MSDKPSLENAINAIQDLTEELKKTNRRIDSLQSTTDLLFADRQIIEDTFQKVGEASRALKENTIKQNETNKAIQTGLEDVKSTVTTKAKETKDLIDKNTVIVKSSGENIIKSIINRLKRKKGVIEK